MENNKPTIISEGTHTLEDLKNLRNSKSIWKEFDVYEDQLKELFEINNPSLKSGDNYESKRRLHHLSYLDMLFPF